MGPSKMFALNCALAATIFTMICGIAALPINSLYAFYGLSIAGLVLALRKAGRPAAAGGWWETPLRRFLFTQAIVAALAFQVASAIGFSNRVWDDQAWPPLFAIGATALAVNFLLRIGSVARLRSPRQTITTLAFTGAAAAALLWAIREYYAFYLLYVLWLTQLGIGINRLASAGRRRYFAAMSILFALMGLSTFLVIFNPFNIPPWES